VRRKPAETYDNSFAENLEKSGFLKELWATKRSANVGKTAEIFAGDSGQPARTWEPILAARRYRLSRWMGCTMTRRNLFLAIMAAGLSTLWKSRAVDAAAAPAKSIDELQKNWRALLADGVKVPLVSEPLKLSKTNGANG